MTNLPTHSGSGDETDLGTVRESTPSSRWKTIAAVVAVLAAIAIVVVLHLTGVLGAGAH